jgi:predicted nucleic acid-binding protein
VTAGAEPIIVDTNILFSALVRTESAFSRILIRSEREFVVCETTLAELFRKKEKLVRATRMDDAALTRGYYLLLKRVQLHKEVSIPRPCWHEAYELCRGIDEEDAPQVALTLALDGLLWTGDKVLRSGLSEKGFDRFFTP